MFEYFNIINPNEKSLVCENILGALPSRFAGEKSIIVYAHGVRTMETWAASHNGQIVGFISVDVAADQTAQIYVMGVVEPTHKHRDVRTTLIKKAAESLAKQGIILVNGNGRMDSIQKNKEDSRFYEFIEKFFQNEGELFQ